MKTYWRRRLIDILTLRKSLKSCLFICLAFFLGQLGALSKSQEIINYCNKLQETYPDGIVYHLTQLIKIFFADGNILALIISGILVVLFIYLIYFKESHYEDLEVFKSTDEARKALGKGKRFRFAQANIEGVSSPNDSATGFT